jgi:hypothetical protein
MAPVNVVLRMPAQPTDGVCDTPPTEQRPKSGLKLYIFKERITTTPQTANPIKVNCGKANLEEECAAAQEQKK